MGEALVDVVIAQPIHVVLFITAQDFNLGRGERAGSGGGGGGVDKAQREKQTR